MWPGVFICCCLFVFASNQFKLKKNVSVSSLHSVASFSSFPLQGSISSLEEERHISIRRPKTPTSSDFPDLNTQTNWATSLPLPTPEEKMRLHAQTVQADVVPINITGMLCCVGSHSQSPENDCGFLLLLLLSALSILYIRGKAVIYIFIFLIFA